MKAVHFDAKTGDQIEAHNVGGDAAGFCSWKRLSEVFRAADEVKKMRGITVFPNRRKRHHVPSEAAMTSHFKIEWFDHGREPQCRPDPAYPTGKILPAFGPLDTQKCEVDLPYPARRCGLYVVECQLCGIRIGCTTAGRPDDPKQIIIACKTITADHERQKN